MGGDMEDTRFFRNITRRDFLKKAGHATVALGSLELIAACVTSGPGDMRTTASLVSQEKVFFPPLKDSKIQPPEQGCYVGFRKVYAVLGGAQKERELTQRAVKIAAEAKSHEEHDLISKPFIEEMTPIFTANIKKNIDDYEKNLGRQPYLFVLYETPRLFGYFPAKECEAVYSKGVIPFIYAGIQARNPKLSLQVDDIAKGKHDKYIARFAEGANQFGEKHGGFFITTMEEMNGNWYYWGQTSKFKEAWQRIWNTFEDKGANRFATWVWEPYCPDSGNVASPNSMYPGDKYVDWIGLSAFARRKYTTYNSFENLVSATYESMMKTHSEKPIMQSEFGVTNDYGQAKWIKNAFKTIKSMPGMKAAVYHDTVTMTLNPLDDHALNDKSIDGLSTIIKDPYFIMAK